MRPWLEPPRWLSRRHRGHASGADHASRDMGRRAYPVTPSRPGRRCSFRPRRRRPSI